MWFMTAAWVNLNVELQLVQAHELVRLSFVDIDEVKSSRHDQVASSKHVQIEAKSP